MIDSWPRSRSEWERARSVMGGGVSTGLRAQACPHPLFFESGSGAQLVDIDGNSYVDYVLGWGPVILGHAHPELTSAVQRAAAAGATYGAGHRLEPETAHAVLEAIPGMDRLLWNNTGSEATQLALRLARAATGRNRLIKMVGHYHGWSDALLVGYRPDGAGRPAGAGSLGQSPQSIADASLCSFNDLDAVERELRRPDSDIAAVFVEPVACNSGVISPAPGYLQGLRDLCDQYGAVLVFDEVITGFRIAYGGAVERFGVVPDLVTLGKALAGGYSLAAVAGVERVIGLSERGVVHAGTYNGNTVALAAADATLRTLRQPGTFERFEAMGRRLATGMRAALDRHGLESAVSQIGPVVQLALSPHAGESVEAFLAADQSQYDRLSVELLRRGVYVLPGGRWYLSTAHTDHHIDLTLAALDDSLQALADRNDTKDDH